MPEITPEQAREYLKRFELLDERLAMDRRQETVTLRFVQLSALMASRHAFKPDPHRERELALVRDRWARLRQALGG